MKEFIYSIFENEAIMWAVFSVLIFAFTQLLKMPIKYLTKRLTEKKRKRLNLLIYFIPFGLGLLCAWIYCDVIAMLPELDLILHTDFWLMGLKMGSSSIAIYGIIDQFFGVKVKNPYDSESGKKVLKAVNDIVADGKASKGEVINAVKGLTKEEKEQIDNIIGKD